MMTKEQFEVGLYRYRAKVLKVVDGDTLDLDVDQGIEAHRYLRVRLYGVNTPETYGVPKDSATYQAGMKSKDFVIAKVDQVPVWIETYKDRTEKYGRYLVEVWFERTVNGAVEFVNLNELLVAEGLAERKTY